MPSPQRKEDNMSSDLSRQYLTLGDVRMLKRVLFAAGFPASSSPADKETERKAAGFLICQFQNGRSAEQTLLSALEDHFKVTAKRRVDVAAASVGGRFSVRPNPGGLSLGAKERHTEFVTSLSRGRVTGRPR
jgi:hypothetical protein